MGQAWAGWPTATTASIPTELGSVDRERALLEMIETGAFPDTPALARWSETAEAQPILRRYLMARIMPHPSEYFAIDLDAAEAEIAFEDALAADIEARFGA